MHGVSCLTALQQLKAMSAVRCREITRIRQFKVMSRTSVVRRGKGNSRVTRFRLTRLHSRQLSPNSLPRDAHCRFDSKLYANRFALCSVSWCFPTHRRPCNTICELLLTVVGRSARVELNSELLQNLLTFTHLLIIAVSKPRGNTTENASLAILLGLIFLMGQMICVKDQMLS